MWALSGLSIDMSLERHDTIISKFSSVRLLGTPLYASRCVHEQSRVKQLCLTMLRSCMVVAGHIGKHTLLHPVDHTDPL